jgi:hypothetical protein
MLSIVIGDSPDHLLNLTNINSILTTFSLSMNDSAVFETSNGNTLTKSDIDNLNDWISSMMHVLTASYDESNDDEELIIN